MRLAGPVCLLFALSLSSAAAQSPASASVSGTVLDVSGGAVVQAEVTLTESRGSGGRAAVTGPDGTFVFEAVPAGSYVISVTAPGFQEYRSPSFTMTAQQELRVANIPLSIATVTTSVVVQPTTVVAAQQVKAEERQRLFGVIPNFYTSYVWDAAPLNTKQKFSLATRTAFDPAVLVGTSIAAGIEQARNAFPGFGRGAQGYAKRWGALFAADQASEILSRAVFPSLFHQDPRYFYQGSGSTGSRLRHAMGAAFVARSDRGHLMPNYSNVLGELSSGALSNLYYPASSRGAGLVLTNVAIGVAARVGQNLMREFVLKSVTRHVPDNGKPAPSKNP